MTWLDDIEEEGKIEYSDSERMVRVIRELVKYSKILEDAAHPTKVAQARNVLSPDAKEIVEESGK